MILGGQLKETECSNGIVFGLRESLNATKFNNVCKELTHIKDQAAGVSGDMIAECTDFLLSL